MNGKATVEVRIGFLSQGVQLRNAHILFLRGASLEGLYPVLLDQAQTELMLAAMTERKYPATGVATDALQACGIAVRAVCVSLDSQGGYKARVLLETEDGVPRYLICDVAHGLCLAMQSDARIFVPAAEFADRRQSTSPDGQVAFPLTVMSADLLREALDAAVANDEFEQAAQLQKEIDRRRGH